ncbi:MarR family transcriptional regulator [Streptomyces sp. Ru73]|uniref:MarR family winged helix-turn-helix transcriptional regulator n=1 Tax=Streptomyces sp. Ru73 TaxID=2080748 RepID=UPI000CDE39A3|nr:MarR family transcriptional regulator [Streptomyces sp. Ru73]POX42288.1 MarR family transcriptional regulator [Streptomyces sp. Ru73]
MSPTASGEELDHAAVELRNSLMRITRRLRAQRPPGELNLGALAVLGRLDRDGPATASELAAAERVTPQSIARPVTRLVELGLVERRPDPADGRQTLLHPTEQGLAFLRADRERRDVWLARAMATHLSDVERDLLHLAARLLDRLAAADDEAEQAPSG